ncbi:hypothetical protein VNO78_33321 [Psophocarpus tetragonolobus]|uniref:Uncharacterized protein n=1 Tax=Psophocarpus tetragonolobus TaxID=3891 RepID=A0AAN9NXS0_PSOTE
MQEPTMEKQRGWHNVEGMGFSLDTKVGRDHTQMVFEQLGYDVRRDGALDIKEDAHMQQIGKEEGYMDNEIGLAEEAPSYQRHLSRNHEEGTSRELKGEGKRKEGRG